MKKTVNKILLIIIVVLLLANVAMLFLFVLPRGEKNHSEKRSGVDSGMASVFREKVGFTEQQVTDYLSLRKIKRPVLKDKFSDLRRVKEHYYFTMYSGNDSIASVYSDSLALKQKIVDSTMRAYLIDIRRLCTPQQLPQFDTVMKRTIWRMIGKPVKKNGSTKK